MMIGSPHRPTDRDTQDSMSSPYNLQTSKYREPNQQIVIDEKYMQQKYHFAPKG